LTMIAVDVYYYEDSAIVAGLLFTDWTDEKPENKFALSVHPIAPYEPGYFYKRELPCILELLTRLPDIPEYIIVDGYVYLDQDYKPGLGQYLYEALNQAAIVIGVAKTRFKDIPTHTELLRGNSQRPLYVTAAGISVPEAKSLILKMGGEHRIPTLLKQVDRLSKKTSNP
jgi:deoxyribonuclease V